MGHESHKKRAAVPQMTYTGEPDRYITDKRVDQDISGRWYMSRHMIVTSQKKELISAHPTDGTGDDMIVTSRMQEFTSTCPTGGTCLTVIGSISSAGMNWSTDNLTGVNLVSLTNLDTMSHDSCPGMYGLHTL